MYLDKIGKTLEWFSKPGVQGNSNAGADRMLNHDIKEITNALKINKTLTSIDLRYNEISEQIADVLKVNETLTSIDLIGNGISDNGAKEIANALKINQTLTRINLSFNRISKHGAKEIADALKVNKTLTSMNLSYNKISDIGAKKIADALKINQTLTSIDLGCNEISDDGTKEIADALKINKTLTSIDLYVNKISERGTKEIADALKVNKTLTNIDLTENKISERGAKEIADSLKINKTLTSINLHGNGISDDGAKEIVDALKINQTLTSIDLSVNKISERGTKEIADALKINQTLTSIDLSYNLISADDAKEIADSLKINQTLTSIGLSYNLLSADSVKEIADALKINQTLTSIDLSSNEISADDVEEIADALKVNKTLTNIDLSENKISERGTKAITDVLKINQTLTSIDLGYILLSDDSAKEIAEALKINQTLTSINLDRSKISVDGAKEIANALKINKTLTSIDLSWNKISDDSAKGIADALKINQTLTSINLSSNEISDNGAKEIADALKVNKTLTSINLSYNGISKHSAKEIADALKVNKTLTSINLSYNKISERGTKEIADALKINETLTSIDLRCNEISERGAKEIADALKVNKTLTSINLSKSIISEEIADTPKIYNTLNIFLSSKEDYQCDLSSNYLGKRVQAWAEVVLAVYKIVRNSSNEFYWRDLLEIDPFNQLENSILEIRDFCTGYHDTEPKKLACAIYITVNHNYISTCNYLCIVLGAVMKDKEYSVDGSLEKIGCEIALHLNKYLKQDLLNGQAAAKISNEVEVVKEICDRVKNQSPSDFRPINEACKMAGLPLILNNYNEEYYDMPRLWDVENDCLVVNQPNSNYQIGFVSHVWEEDEVTYATLQGRSKNISKGSIKLKNLRKELRQIRRYWWLDTICINKSDLAELDMSIRSMYRWYQAADVVVIPQTTPLQKWATRGWCLQEGLAARWLLHDNKEWFTNTGFDFGFGFKYNNANSHELLQLMESRETTRHEDMAYCLVGILQLDFPIMYGEGYRAQERLLEALCQQHGDLSWFYWRGFGSNRHSLLPGKGCTYNRLSLPKIFSQMTNNCTVNHLGLELTCRLLFKDSQTLSRLKTLLLKERTYSLKRRMEHEKKINSIYSSRVYLYPGDVTTGYNLEKSIEMIESQSDHLAVCFIPEIFGASLVQVIDIRRKVFRHLITVHWQEEIPDAATETRVTIG